MTTYARELAPSLWPDIMPLLYEHKQEIAFYEDIDLCPDMARYNAVEEKGCLRCYTARIHGLLVGYAIFFLDWNLHYAHSLQANQDVLFVTKPYRYGRVGLGLIQYSERQLMLDGAQVIYQHLKLKTPQTITLFERLGYAQMDVVMTKRLDR